MWHDKRTAFEDAALPHLDAVYRFALHLSGKEAEAEDLVQDTFHQAYRSFHQFRRGSNCRAWLFRIARNARIDHLRRKAREPEFVGLEEQAVPSREPDANAVHMRRFAGHPIDDDEVFYDLFGDEVNRFLRELPDDFRTAVVLCDVEGFSYQEIAEIVGCPIGTVRSRISRARDLLREKLHRYAKGLGYVRSR